MEETCIYDSKVMGIKYTIAIPTYKRSASLIEAVETALEQTCKIDYEVLIVDNNPERNDETEQLMNRYRDNSMVSYYKNSENLGMSGNWNKLYQLAKGDYVIMLHDDDMLFKTTLEIMNLFMESTDFKFEQVYPLFDVIRNRSKLAEPKVPLELKYKIKKHKDFATGAILGVPSGMLLKKDAFNKIGPFRDDFYPILDQEFAFRSCMNVRCCQIRIPLFMYYVGINESMNPATIHKMAPSVDTFQTYTRNYMSCLWRLFSKLCRRANLLEMCVWSNIFSSQEEIKIGLRQVKHIDNQILNKLSKICQIALKGYLHFVRTKKVKLSSI